jgi:aspartyl-tRNA(Asn)/glutamyl-tRNA(Gln) amidotransferase subunit B
MEAKKYIPTIGLEIHAELATASKMFCSCANNPDEERPNMNICPVCMGHPGTLPVLNFEAIKEVIKIGLAAKGTIADFTEWDRKNYFYPDIPKGYQISQYKYPLVSGGEIAGVEITRVHLEEDTAQSTHDAVGAHVADKSLVNFNRAGVPLMELVTEPVIHDAATAVRFAKELQLLLRTLGAGEANMEKGEMRVEANISVASAEDTAARRFGTKTEVKNLNSFRSVERAIAYEIDRQTSILEKNSAGDMSEKIVQETRGWDDVKQKTFSQRAKESSHDYRYFPDPDIPKLKISEIPELASATLMKELKELPWNKRARYAKEYAMTEKEVAVFVEGPAILSKYFEDVVSLLAGTSGQAEQKSVRLTINYLLTDYVGILKKEHGEVEYLEPYLSKISPAQFAGLISLVLASKVNSRGAKDILAILYTEGGMPEDIAGKRGFIQNITEVEIRTIAQKIITENPTVIADYKAGKQAALQFLIGQGMKATKGAANPETLKTIFLGLIV